MKDALYAIAFALALAFPLLVLGVVVFKRWLKLGAGLLGLYVAIYIPLSVGGQYVVANHGGNDWRREWLPRGLAFEYVSRSGRSRTDLTLVGAVFWPCLFFDHLFWHRTSAASV
jgi:hypothetical protein